MTTHAINERTYRRDSNFSKGSHTATTPPSHNIYTHPLDWPLHCGVHIYYCIFQKKDMNDPTSADWASWFWGRSLSGGRDKVTVCLTGTWRSDQNGVLLVILARRVKFAPFSCSGSLARTLKPKIRITPPGLRSQLRRARVEPRNRWGRSRITMGNVGVRYIDDANVWRQ
jgi:hypothetical protein